LISLVLLCFMVNQPASFYLETIEIEGAGLIGRGIILSRAQLREGEPYTERELRAAGNAIRQLGFVRDARFSLRKGSARGRFVLVIEIEANSLFFAEGTFDWHAYPSTGDVIANDSTSIGARLFIGAAGMLYTYIVPRGTGDDFHLGYSHFNLFGQGISLNLEHTYREPDVEPNPLRHIRHETGLYLNSSISVPLQRNHRLELSHIYVEDRVFFRVRPRPDTWYAIDQKRIDRFTSLAHLYRTTDDPVFPETGSLIRSTVYFGSRHAGDLIRDPFGERQRSDSLATGGIRIDAEHWYKPAPRQTVGSRFLFEAEERESTPRYPWVSRRTDWQAGLRYRYRTARDRVWGEAYLGIDVDLGQTDLRFDHDGVPDTASDSTFFEVYPNVAWRSRWGLVRVGLSASWRSSAATEGPR